MEAQYRSNIVLVKDQNFDIVQDFEPYFCLLANPFLRRKHGINILRFFFVSLSSTRYIVILCLSWYFLTSTQKLETGCVGLRNLSIELPTIVWPMVRWIWRSVSRGSNLYNNIVGWGLTFLLISSIVYNIQNLVLVKGDYNI